jgi:hypothetical protein
MSNRKKQRDSDLSKATSLPPATYQINVRALSATNLTAANGAGRADPFISLQLVGGTQSVSTRVLQSTLTPVWDEILPPLDGYFIANDVLVIRVIDKSRRPEVVLGAFELPLRKIPLGITTEQTITLSKCSKQGKINKKGDGGGAAGTALFLFSLVWLGEPAFVDRPWGWPMLTADVEFVGVVGIPGDGSDTFFVVKLAPDLRDQKTKTKAKKWRDPEWRQTKSFKLGSPEGHSLLVRVYHKDDKIATVAIVLDEFSVGETQIRTYPLTSAKGAGVDGTLTLAITITCENPGVVKGLIEPTRRLMGAACDFNWGDYPSSYSTDFTGYTECSLTLSDLGDAEYALHEHEEVEPLEDEPMARVGALALTGTVIGARGLSVRDSYVRVNICTKCLKILKKTESEVVHNTDNPQWGHAFDLGEVKKGQAVEVTVLQKTSEGVDVEVGYARTIVKEIEIDSVEPIEIPVVKGKWKREPAEGVLVVVFNLTVKDEDSDSAGG